MPAAEKLAVLLAAAALAALPGCGGDDSEDATDSPPPAEVTTTPETETTPPPTTPDTVTGPEGVVTDEDTGASASKRAPITCLREAGLERVQAQETATTVGSSVGYTGAGEPIRVRSEASEEAAAERTEEASATVHAEQAGTWVVVGPIKARDDEGKTAEVAQCLREAAR